MPRRLGARRPLGDGCLLVDAPLPSTPAGRRFELAGALEAAFSVCGSAVSYDEIMTLSGLGVRWTPWDETPNPAQAESLRAWLIPALRDLGWSPKLWDGGPETAAELTEREVAAGRPLVALGWGPAPHGWSVISGYDRAAGVICGRSVASAGSERVGAPAQAELILALGSPRAPADPITAVRGTIERIIVSTALPSRQRERRHNWLTAVAQGPVPGEGPPEDTVREVDLAVERMLDARMASSRWLAQLADGGEDLFRSWLRHAAQRFERVVEMLEARRPPLLSPEAASAFADRSWRNSWVAQLGRAAERDEGALAHLRAALTAEHGPDDEDE